MNLKECASRSKRQALVSIKRLAGEIYPGNPARRL
jgi:hypothetical protein